MSAVTANIQWSCFYWHLNKLVYKVKELNVTLMCGSWLTAQRWVVVERLTAVRKNVMSSQEPAAEGLRCWSAVFPMARENSRGTTKSWFTGLQTSTLNSLQLWSRGHTELAYYGLWMQPLQACRALSFLEMKMLLISAVFSAGRAS